METRKGLRRVETPESVKHMTAFGDYVVFIGESGRVYTHRDGKTEEVKPTALPTEPLLLDGRWPFKPA